MVPQRVGAIHYNWRYLVPVYRAKAKAKASDLSLLACDDDGSGSKKPNHVLPRKKGKREPKHQKNHTTRPR